MAEGLAITLAITGFRHWSLSMGSSSMGQFSHYVFYCLPSLLRCRLRHAFRRHWCHYWCHIAAIIAIIALHYAFILRHWCYYATTLPPLSCHYALSLRHYMPHYTPLLVTSHTHVIITFSRIRHFHCHCRHWCRWLRLSLAIKMPLFTPAATYTFSHAAAMPHITSLLFSRHIVVRAVITPHHYIEYRLRRHCHIRHTHYYAFITSYYYILFFIIIIIDTLMPYAIAVFIIDAMSFIFAIDITLLFLLPRRHYLALMPSLLLPLMATLPFHIRHIIFAIDITPAYYWVIIFAIAIISPLSPHYADIITTPFRLFADITIAAITVAIGHFAMSAIITPYTSLRWHYYFSYAGAFHYRYAIDDIISPYILSPVTMPPILPLFHCHTLSCCCATERATLPPHHSFHDILRFSLFFFHHYTPLLR